MPLPRNLPNLITGSRLVLAASLFTLLVLVDAGRSSPEPSGHSALRQASACS